MPHYLLSVHSERRDDTADDAMTEPGPDPRADEAMAEMMERVNALERDMRAQGAFVFTGALTDASSATVVRSVHAGSMSMTDGPFAETKEHIGGFYVIEAADLDAALTWAGRVVECIGAPIEVRPFHHAVTLD